MSDVHTVDAEAEGGRLDRFLARVMSDHSRSAIQRWIRGGRVTVGGVEALRPSRPMSEGESVTVDVPPPRPTTIEPEDIPIDVLYEDDWISVVDKPAGLIVHPGAGRRDGTLVNALVHRYRTLSQAGGPDRPGIVHRLDRDTSGALVVARTEAAHANLSEQFAERTVEKEYVAIVEGVLELDSDWIELPIGRDPGHRERMTVRDAGRESATFYRVERRFARHTLVRLHPKTGRTHQLRVHLKAIGYPILADPLYGRGGTPVVAAPRLMLHAEILTLDHPEDGARRRFEAPVPGDILSVLDLCERRTR